MRTSLKMWLGLAFLWAMAGFPGTAAAQQRVRCESNDGGRHYCGQYDPDQVRLNQQVSGSPCIQGQTWGVDRDGLWVDRGCRADFMIVPRAERQMPAQRVRCESNDGERHYCGQYDPDAVRLDRQISGTPCIQGRTWGVDRQGLWVDRGCRAEFVFVRGNGRRERGARGGVDLQLRLPEWVHPSLDDQWPPRGNWRGGNWERGGACFYKGYNFSGDNFCMRRGESFRSIGNFGDKISSIRVFGGAEVIVFNDRDFRSDNDATNRSVRDLRVWRMSRRPDHTWNKRISSVQVQ